MPRVDFYVLGGQRPNGRLLLACRLAEKAYDLGHKVYVHAAGREQAMQLDELLWTFRDGSFVPHALAPVAENDLSPVRIGWAEQAPPPPAAVLINLGHEVPAFFNRFERVAELVDQDPETLRRSRERFRFYRMKGCSPDSHKL